MPVSLIIIFLTSYHLMLVYSRQQKTYGRQCNKYRSLPTSSARKRYEIVFKKKKKNSKKGSPNPREWHKIVSHTSLPFWGLLCCLALQSTQHFDCDPAKHFCISHVLPPLAYRELFVHVKTNLHFCVLLGQVLGTNHLSGCLFCSENQLKKELKKIIFKVWVLKSLKTQEHS